MKWEMMKIIANVAKQRITKKFWQQNVDQATLYLTELQLSLNTNGWQEPQVNSKVIFFLLHSL